MVTRKTLLQNSIARLRGASLIFAVGVVCATRSQAVELALNVPQTRFSSELGMSTIQRNQQQLAPTPESEPLLLKTEMQIQFGKSQFKPVALAASIFSEASGFEGASDAKRNPADTLVALAFARMKVSAFDRAPNVLVGSELKADATFAPQPRQTSPVIAVVPAPLEMPPLLASQGSSNAKLLELRRLVDQVLARHPELYQAEAESRAAELRTAASRAGYMPQSSLASSLGLQRQTISTTNRSVSYKQRLLQLRLNQVLYDPVLAAQIEQNKATSVAADWQLTGVREQLMARTLELYIELVRHNSLTTLASENLQTHRRYAGQIKDIARSDLGRSADLPAVSARVALAESVLVSRVARLDTARVQWTQLSGLPSPLAAADTVSDAEQLPIPALAPQLETLVAHAIETSPTLFKATADIEAAKQAAQGVLAAYQPRLGAEISLRGGQDFSSIQGGQRDAYLGVTLDWKLPLNGMRGHQNRAAQEAVIAAQYAKQRLQQELDARVRALWYELLAAETSLKIFETYTLNAQQVVQVYQEQFRIGRRSLLDLLNAENELFTARSNATTTRQDILVSAWRLSALAGKLREELGL